MAFDDPVVWVLLLFIILLFVLLPYYLYARYRSNRRKVTESVVLSMIRSRNGATLDEIIIGAHISSEEANKIIQKLIASNVLKSLDKDGKTFFVTS